MRARVFSLVAVLAAVTAQSFTTPTPVSVGGAPAQYQIPPGHPAGDVRVTSFGIAQASPQAGGSNVSVLHVRMIIANKNDTQPWTLDTRNVLAAISGEGQSGPAFVNTDAGKPPTLQIARGEQRVVDLYYPLPTTLSTVPNFDVSWQLDTSRGVVTERTAFQPAPASNANPSANSAGTSAASYPGYPYDSGYADPYYPPYSYPYYSAYGYPPYGYPGYGYPGYGYPGYGYPGYAYPVYGGPAVSLSFGFGFGFGPFWWSNPFFFNHGFVHHPFFHGDFHHGVVVSHGGFGRTFVAGPHGGFVAGPRGAFVAGPHGGFGGFHGGMAGFHGGGFHGGGFHGGGFHGGGFHGGMGGFHGGGFHGGGHR